MIKYLFQTFLGKTETFHSGNKSDEYYIYSGFVLSKSIIDFKKFHRKIHHFSLKAFNFPDEAAVAEHHFKELGRELNIQEENKSSEARSEPNKPTQIEIEV